MDPDSGGTSIEYDGAYWHQDKKDNDIKKNTLCEDNDIFLLRFREHGLPPLSVYDICLKKEGVTLDNIKDAIKKLLRKRNISNSDKDRALMYLKTNKFRGDTLFNEIVHRLPKPPLEKSLAKMNPYIVQYWHPTKNGSLAPEDLHPSSSLKVWWQCNKGHEFKKAVDLMPIIKSNGCPDCRKEKARHLFNQHNIIKKIHPKKNKSLDLKSITVESSLKVWWQCEKGHEWEEAIRKAGKRNENNFCKICRSLPVKFPGIASEWHPTKNKPHNVHEVTYGSRLLAWWQCEKGHEWTAQVKKRTKRLSTCPKCHRNTISEHYADLRKKKDKN